MNGVARGLLAVAAVAATMSLMAGSYKETKPDPKASVSAGISNRPCNLTSLKAPDFGKAANFGRSACPKPLDRLGPVLRPRQARTSSKAGLTAANCPVSRQGAVWSLNGKPNQFCFVGTGLDPTMLVAMDRLPSEVEYLGASFPAFFLQKNDRGGYRIYDAQRDEFLSATREAGPLALESVPLATKIAIYMPKGDSWIRVALLSEGKDQPRIDRIRALMGWWDLYEDATG